MTREQVGPRIERTEVDGVRTFRAEGEPGPTYAQLLFNVGVSSESLATRGISHLVEHLACFAAGQPSHPAGAWVGEITTAFWAEGEPEEVARYLSGVARALSDLPLDRLETERQILRIEGDEWPGIDAFHRWFRFGSHRHGLVGDHQFGLRRLGAQEVEAWAGERFTRGNAVLWVAGPLPDGLSLPLPAGPRLPPIPVEPISHVTLPAALDWLPDTVSISFLAAPSTELAHALWILDKRLRATLRYELGVSYAVYRASGSLTTGLMQHCLWADCNSETAARVRDELLAVVDRLARLGPTQEELSEAVADMRTWLELPRNVGSHLARHAEAELLGERGADYVDVERSIAPESLVEAFEPVVETAVVTVPQEVELPAHGFHAYPVWSSDVVLGETYRPHGLANRWADVRQDGVVVGEQGVTRFWEGNAVTVYFDQCGAMLRAEDGRRVLIGRDGMRLRFDASQYRRGGHLLVAIDQRISENLVLPMEEGDCLTERLSVARVAPRERGLQALLPGDPVELLLLGRLGGVEDRREVEVRVLGLAQAHRLVDAREGELRQPEHRERCRGDLAPPARRQRSRAPHPKPRG